VTEGVGVGKGVGVGVKVEDGVGVGDSVPVLLGVPLWVGEGLAVSLVVSVMEGVGLFDGEAVRVNTEEGVDWLERVHFEVTEMAGDREWEREGEGFSDAVGDMEEQIEKLGEGEMERDGYTFPAHLKPFQEVPFLQITPALSLVQPPAEAREGHQLEELLLCPQPTLPPETLANPSPPWAEPEK